MPPCPSTYGNAASWWLKPSSFWGHQQKCCGISCWIDLRSYCSSCQLCFFSRDGWRKWESTSPSSPFTAWYANLCWNMLVILFQRWQSPAEGQDWQFGVASATRHELLGLVCPHCITLGLGDWSLWDFTKNFTKMTQIIRLHQQRACCLLGITSYSRCNCLLPGEANSWGFMGARVWPHRHRLPSRL